jgi:hypothetical protein
MGLLSSSIIFLGFTCSARAAQMNSFHKAGRELIEAALKRVECSLRRYCRKQQQTPESGLPTIAISWGASVAYGLTG